MLLHPHLHPRNYKCYGKHYSSHPPESSIRGNFCPPYPEPNTSVQSSPPGRCLVQVSVHAVTFDTTHGRHRQSQKCLHCKKEKTSNNRAMLVYQTARRHVKIPLVVLDCMNIN